MKILEIRPVPPGAGTKTLAYLDVEIGGHLRLYNLTIRRNTAGRLRVAAPNALGSHTATFHPELAETITRAADAALKGEPEANDRAHR